MAEVVPVPVPSSPVKEDATKKPASPTATGAKKYEGDGLPFRAKLIGMEDLNVDRDEKVCLDSMFKLKAVVRARGEHKQRIQLNLTMSAVKVIDDTSKTQIALHEIERISFVVIDPRDTRAFGYIYNTSDDRHQFWAIKTERAAAVTVLALKEVFELAFEEYTKGKMPQAEAPKPASPTVSTPPAEPAVLPSAPVETTVVTTPPPVVTPPQPSILDDDLFGPGGFGAAPPAPAVSQPPPADIWNLAVPAPAVIQPVAKVDDPFGDIFADVKPATTPQVNSAAQDDPLFDLFSDSSPATAAAPMSFSNFSPYVPTQPAFPNPTPMFAQPPQPFMPTLLTPSQPVQQNFLAATPVSPIAPPTVTNPLAGFDLLGLSSAAPAKTGKEAFFPAAPPKKTIQQLEMERRP